ncbi:hypothetical protein PHAVU_011G175401 [Phaseolus vulgaris]
MGQRWAFLTHGQRRCSSLTHDDNPLIHDGNALTHDENPLIHDGNALTHDENPLIHDGNALTHGNAVHLSLTATLLISHSRQHNALCNNALCASLLRRRPTFIIESTRTLNLYLNKAVISSLCF